MACMRGLLLLPSISSSAAACWAAFLRRTSAESTLLSEPDRENSSASSNGLFSTDWLFDCSLLRDKPFSCASFSSGGAPPLAPAPPISRLFGAADWSNDWLTSTASSYLSFRNLRSFSCYLISKKAKEIMNKFVKNEENLNSYKQYRNL